MNRQKHANVLKFLPTLALGVDRAVLGVCSGGGSWGKKRYLVEG